MSFATPSGLMWTMRSRPSLRHCLVAERDHVAELPARVDMHQREGRLRGIEGLHGEMQHDGRILADRIEHHRLLAFGRDFADDVDALRFQPLEMGQSRRAGGNGHTVTL